MPHPGSLTAVNGDNADWKANKNGPVIRVANALYEYDLKLEGHDPADYPFATAFTSDVKHYRERAQTALRAIKEYVAVAKTDRYGFDAGEGGFAIYDKKEGRNNTIGIVHDAGLAQQIVDDLNEHAARVELAKW